MSRGPAAALLPASFTAGSTDFIWATGIEDTFISRPDARTGRTLDEYDLTGHYEQWRADLELAASLGVRAIRYGIPWYRVQPETGRFDWSWTDRVLETAARDLGLTVILDLVHYGTPGWLEGSFSSPDYPARVAAYSAAVAGRYRGLCAWFTPLNEPRITAWYSGRLGWWPPYGHSWAQFARVLAAVAKGVVLAQQAIRAAAPEAGFVHVDATDLYFTLDASLVEETTIRQEIVFLALDLLMGRVSPSHPLHAWLRGHGVAEREIGWFDEHHVRPDIIGYNMYPMYSRKQVLRNARGHLEAQIRRCGVETFTELTRMYAARYGLPVMCTETASNGPPAWRSRWIEETHGAVRALRREGVAVVGYTYWPLFALIGWAYQRGAKPRDRSLVQMGLWDLKPGEDGRLERVETPSAGAYRRAVAEAVTPLGAA